MDGRVLEQMDVAGIETQLKAQIEALRREYGIPMRRVLYYALVHGAARQVPRLTLPGKWKTK